MVQPRSDQDRFTAERVLRTRAKTYRAVVQLLGEGATVMYIAKRHRVSEHTVRAIRAIGTGVAVDKMLALTGQMPAVQIANVIMPSETDREKRRELLDKLAARLSAPAE